ncbi:MAG: DUF2723 domain-containing protein [candidate division Zixibacteria bacterium]|nr:DUF2723 domain-containing protein [candidate division Zixibacteria bacterium]
MELPEIQFQPVKKDNVNNIISAIVFIISFWTYYATMAPTVSFWDCGEFIACSYILGIPHPPGTPLFILIGRVFTMIPISSDIAVRVNFISVLTSAIAVWLAYLIIVRVVKYWFGGNDLNLTRRIVAYSGGISGAMFLTYSSTFWFNAVEAEVYGISMMLMLIITYLAFIWAERRDQPGSGRYLVAITYLAFLSVGIHMTIFLVMPVIFFLIILVDRSKLMDWRIWLAGASMFLVTFTVDTFLYVTSGVFLLSLSIILSKKADMVWKLVFSLMIVVVIGYSVQVFIPIRASQQPAINENNPETWSSFKAFLERKQYGQESMITRMFSRRGTWANQFGEHRNMGFGGFFKRQYSSTEWPFIAVPFVLGILGIWEALRRKWKIGVFLLIMLLVCTVGLVLYMNFSDGTMGERLEVRERDYFFTPGFMFFAILIGVGVSGFILWVFDLFGNKITERIRLVIAVTMGILAIAFPLTHTRAHHWFTHDRTGNYIPWDYAYNILNSCDENGIIFTNGDNDTFPLWFMQEVEGVRKDVKVVNLSLLNTQWYIHQLKDQMGVPIRLSDSQIDKLTPMLTPDRQVIRVQDVMVQEIITANKWKYPVYFAVTVSKDNRIGLDDNLRMEGMTYRVVPEKAKDQIDPELLEHRLTNVFKFRGLADTSVYKNENDSRLIANYISAFLQLAEYYKGKGDIDRAVGHCENAIEIYPYGWRPYAFLVQIYSELDDFKMVESTIRRAPQTEKERLYLNSAYAYDNKGKIEDAINVYKKVLQFKPDSEMAFQFLLQLYYQHERFSEAVELIDNYVSTAVVEPQRMLELQQVKTELKRKLNSNDNK